MLLLLRIFREQTHDASAVTPRRHASCSLARVLRIIAVSLSGWVALLGAGQAHAIDPARLTYGSVFVQPQLKSVLSYDDNIFDSSFDSEESWIMENRPQVEAWTEKGRNRYGGGLEIADFRFFDSSDDNVTDYRGWLDAYHEFSARNSVALDAEYLMGHERRGEGLSEGGLDLLLDEPIEFDRTGVGGVYTLGSQDSDGRLELEYRYRDLKYTNFRELTRPRDRDGDKVRTTFYYRVAPRTDALLELSYNREDYDRNFPGSEDPNFERVPSRDSDEWAYLVGVTWTATAKTTGTVKVGGYEREFDVDERSKEDGFRWEVLASWYPRSYSHFRLRTAQFSQETNGGGNFVATAETELRWEHDWNDRMTTRISGLYAQDDYKQDRREDDRYRAEAKMIYAVDRWLDVGGGYRYEERDSNASRFSYDGNVFFLELTASL